jgi:hypothetical protein
MSYQNKIIYEDSLILTNEKEYIIYKNNINKINQLQNKIQELNNKIDFINDHEINLDNMLENNINNSISFIENTITLINRFIINKANINKNTKDLYSRVST